VEICCHQFDVTGRAHTDDRTVIYGDRVPNTILTPGMLWFGDHHQVPRVSPEMHILFTSHSDTRRAMTDVSTWRHSSWNPLCVRVFLSSET
jgi:hypothetical protein